MEQNLRIELITLSSLRLDPNNARRHDKKNLEAIKGSLSLFGQRKPIVVSGDNLIVAGNGTVEAARELGWTEIYVARIPHDWTPEQIKAYALADNRTAELAEWDSKILAEQLLELDAEGWDVAEFGFEPLEPPINPDDDEPLNFDEVPTKTTLGDVWKLGDHRLVCGDSTDTSVMDKLMQGEKADMVWTDPPYGVNYVGKTKNSLTIENDNMDINQLEDFLTGAFNNIYQATKPGACWYVASPSGPQFVAFGNPLLKLGVWRQTIIWVKDTLVMGRSDYHWKHETIFYGWTPGAAHHAVPDRKQDTVWEFDRPKRSTEHPTMKPIDLITKSLRNSTNQKEIVLDSFGGSGSTLIACEQTKRVARLIELDPKYCDVIIERWQKLTGLEAERVEL
jgi:site-specific DNA-methyltransferase (adenine-specific)